MQNVIMPSIAPNALNSRPDCHQVRTVMRDLVAPTAKWAVKETTVVTAIALTPDIKKKEISGTNAPTAVAVKPVRAATQGLPRFSSDTFPLVRDRAFTKVSLSSVMRWDSLSATSSGRPRIRRLSASTSRDSDASKSTAWRSRTSPALYSSRSLLEVEPNYSAYKRTEAALQVYLGFAAKELQLPLPQVQKSVKEGDAYPGISNPQAARQASPRSEPDICAVLLAFVCFHTLSAFFVSKLAQRMPWDAQTLSIRGRGAQNPWVRAAATTSDIIRL